MTQLKKRSGSIKGFWDFSAGAIFFTPRTAKVFDGKKFKDKPSILIIGELLATCDCKDKKGQRIRLFKGDSVGVWYRPGFREIAQCRGVPTALKYTHEEEIGKGNPLKVFEVKSADGGGVLFIEEDRRVFSRGAMLGLDIGPNCRVIRPPSEEQARANRSERSDSNGYTGTDDDDEDYGDDDDSSADDTTMVLDDDGKPLF